MSAFVVGHDEIDVIMSFAVDHQASFWDYGKQTRVDITRVSATEFGKVLLETNVDSVHSRYGGDKNDLPGTIGETVAGYKFKYFRDVSPIQVLKTMDCYDYQSCERDDWRDTQAFRIIEELRSKAIRALPGYEEAVYGAPERGRRVA